MRRRGLQGLANPAFLSQFPFCALHRIAFPVVSEWCQFSSRSHLLPRGSSCAADLIFLARQPPTTASRPPQLLASPSNASAANCRGFASAPLFELGRTKLRRR